MIHRLFLIMVFSLVLAACSSRDYFLTSGAIMGTTYSVKVVVDSALSAKQESEVTEGIRKTLAAVDEEFSTYRSSSALMRFNTSEVGQDTKFSKHGFDLLLQSERLLKYTRGYFDPSIGPLVKVWGFGAEASASPPDAGLVTKLLSQAGMKNVLLVRGSNSLHKIGQAYLDLSAIAKGYAVDLVAEYLEQIGYEHFMVEVGGEIRVSGTNVEASPWRLGIETPDFAGRKAYTVVSVTGTSMATSGDYRNFVESPQGRYSHTINPITGYPAKVDIASVSVINESCAEADALATALMAMGAQSGLEFANENGIPAYFIVREKNGLEPKSSSAFKPYLVTN